MAGTARSQTTDATDDGAYNPKADTAFDDKEYSAGDDHPVGARGADNQFTNRDFAKEDRETGQSEQTGQIPRGEVDELMSSTSKEERNVSGRTRGNKVDAWKQEKSMDETFAEGGIAEDAQN